MRSLKNSEIFNVHGGSSISINGNSKYISYEITLNNAKHLHVITDTLNDFLAAENENFEKYLNTIPQIQNQNIKITLNWGGVKKLS